VDEIYHLASPASPPHYMHNPVKTIKTNTMGTINMLGKNKKNISSFIEKSQIIFN
jgi:UDP-glucuronate decarboxylase